MIETFKCPSLLSGMVRLVCLYFNLSSTIQLGKERQKNLDSFYIFKQLFLKITVISVNLAYNVVQHVHACDVY